jgi:hypothetical protein
MVLRTVTCNVMASAALRAFVPYPSASCVDTRVDSRINSLVAGHMTLLFLSRIDRLASAIKVWRL